MKSPSEEPGPRLHGWPGGSEPFADMLCGEWSSEPLCPVSVASRAGRVWKRPASARRMRFGPTGFKTIRGLPQCPPKAANDFGAARPVYSDPNAVPLFFPRGHKLVQAHLGEVLPCPRLGLNDAPERIAWALRLRLDRDVANQVMKA